MGIIDNVIASQPQVLIIYGGTTNNFDSKNKCLIQKQ